MINPRAVQCPVLENKRLGEDIFRMTLRAPDIAAGAAPGQFVHIRHNEAYPLLRRPFSIFSASGDNIVVAYRLAGKFTEVMSGKKKGEFLDVLGPLGKGFPPAQGRLVLVGGGIGAAPLVFAAERAAKNMKTLFLLGAKNAGQLVGMKEIKKSGADIAVATEDGSAGRKGFVTELLKERISENDTVYACGPWGMMRAAAAICSVRGARYFVSLEEKMACGLGVCQGCPVKLVSSPEYKMACKDGPVFPAEEVEWRI